VTYDTARYTLSLHDALPILIALYHTDMKKRYLVFTDLDGTLLNHQNYSFAPAKEALALLKYRSIPLIIATSKTFSEVVVLQKERSEEHTSELQSRENLVCRL